MTAREVVERLREAGFIGYHGAKHDVFKHPDGRKTLVPRHKGDLPIGTLKAIQKDTNVTLIK